MIAGRRVIGSHEFARTIEAGNHAKVGHQHSAAWKQRELLCATDWIRKRSTVEVWHLRIAADVELFHIGAFRCVIHRALVWIENNVTRSAALNGNRILGDQSA